jgi:hypothetical protein
MPKSILWISVDSFVYKFIEEHPVVPVEQGHEPKLNRKPIFLLKLNLQPNRSLHVADKYVFVPQRNMP